MELELLSKHNSKSCALNFKNIFNSLQLLYNELPTVPCERCGLCCVSPTCTLVEFTYLINYCQVKMDRGLLADIICRPPSFHQDYDGNLQCRFLYSRNCMVHEGRTGACRLFGLPSLRLLPIENLEHCKKNLCNPDNSFDNHRVEQWLNKLIELNRSIYPISAAPYFITGLNIECWLDIYFNDSLDFDIFQNIKHFMNSCFDLSYLKGSYRTASGIKEKIDKITILDTLLDSGDYTVLSKLLRSLIDDYPVTGTYFLSEAQQFLTTLNKQSQHH